MVAGSWIRAWSPRGPEGPRYFARWRVAVVRDLSARLEQRAEQQQHTAEARDRPRELETGAQQQHADAQHDAAGQQQAPVELFVGLDLLPLVGVALQPVDDPEGNIAVGLMADLEVFAAAGDGDLEEGGA